MVRTQVPYSNVSEPQAENCTVMFFLHCINCIWKNTELLGFWKRCLISTWLARNDAVAQGNYIINLLEGYKAIKAVVMVCNLIAEL